jgi:hypothetical protein
MIQIEENKSDLARYIEALGKTAEEYEKQANDLPKRCAEEFQLLLIKNITTQAFPWVASRSQRYKDWKMQRVGHLKHWILDGDLLGAITHWKESDAWIAGIPSGIFDRGGKNYSGGAPMEIAIYARSLEYGEGTQPARPLFGPSTEQYEKTKMPEQIEKTAKEIESKWK